MPATKQLIAGLFWDKFGKIRQHGTYILGNGAFEGDGFPRGVGQVANVLRERDQQLLAEDIPY